VASASRPRRIESGRLPRLRAAAQLLHRPTSARDPAEVARAIAGAQAQDRYAARLTFRSRSRKLTAADIDRARTVERALLRTWLMRMTVHMIPTDDAGWMLPLFEPVMEKWSRRRLGQLGMPANTQEKALRMIERMLANEGPLSRTEVRDRLRRGGIGLDQQTGLHIVGLATVSGLAIQGPDLGASPSMVLREDWLGEAPRFDRDAALAELARRYLRAFAPASDLDLAYWAGLPLGQVRAGLAAIAEEVREIKTDGEVLHSLKSSTPRLPRPGQLRMLGAFDTYLLGYKSRDFVAASPEEAKLVKEVGAGWVHPVIVRDGRVIGGWRMRRPGTRLEISLRRGAELSAAERNEVDGEIEDIGRFEGLTATLADD
jgi:hypothetical protein